MTRRTKAIIATAGAIAALGAGGAAVAAATGGEDGGRDERITGPAADQARAAALAKAPGGTVEGVERADDGAKGYEVEIKATDGTSLEIVVDPQFRVVSVNQDD